VISPSLADLDYKRNEQTKNECSTNINESSNLRNLYTTSGPIKEVNSPRLKEQSELKSTLLTEQED